MTNKQAIALRPGARVRRKQPLDDGAARIAREVYLVERVYVMRSGPISDVTIHAGGQPFKPWEIERVRDEE